MANVMKAIFDKKNEICKIYKYIFLKWKKIFAQIF